MSQEQILKIIDPGELLISVQDLRRQKYRLVQIGATRLPEQIEMTYSFDLEQHLLSLRVYLPLSGARMPSVTPIYWCAFLYENEIHDLFEVGFDALQVDFHGNLYRTSVKFPFAVSKAPAAQPAGLAERKKEGSGRVTPSAEVIASLAK